MGVGLGENVIGVGVGWGVGVGGKVTGVGVGNEVGSTSGVAVGNGVGNTTGVGVGTGVAVGTGVGIVESCCRILSSISSVEGPQAISATRESDANVSSHADTLLLFII